MSVRMSTRSSGTWATPTLAERGAPNPPVSAFPRVNALNMVVLPLEGRPIMPIFIKNEVYFYLTVRAFASLFLLGVFNRTASSA